MQVVYTWIHFILNLLSLISVVDAIEHIEDSNETCPYGKSLEREDLEGCHEENVKEDGHGGWPWHEWHRPISRSSSSSSRYHVLKEGGDGDHKPTKKYETPPLLLEFPRKGEA